MTHFPSFGSLSMVAGLVGLTLIPGAWTIATAPIAQLSTDVMTGATQRQYEERFDDSFPLRDAVRQTWAGLKFGALGEVAEGAIAGRNGVLFTAEEFKAPLNTRDFGTALRTATAQITAQGAELIPVIVPDKARMMPGSLSHVRSDHFDARYDRMIDMVRSNGLRTVDLRATLSAPGSFMVTDTHWSPLGARDVAQSIATLLGGEIETDTVFKTVQTGTRPFDGDLLAFADTGRWRSAVGPAPETIDTFETTQTSGGMDLFGDAEVPVALVGTSFSARSEFHFAGFLKSSLQADVILFAMEGQGPFVPMDDFLAVDTIPAGTQIVVWEIPERYITTWSPHP